MSASDGLPEDEIIAAGSRNPLYDALALGLVTRYDDKRIYATSVVTDAQQSVPLLKLTRGHQPKVRRDFGLY